MIAASFKKKAVTPADVDLNFEEMGGGVVRCIEKKVVRS